MTTLQFLGAAGTVTGSRFLLQHQGKNILFDCGLFQGLKELRLRNWADFPIEPRDIHAVVLTHAHIDHTGYLPRLVKQGFSGPIFCSEGTADLCNILLRDSAFIQEEDAAFANKKGFSKHHPALPLYTVADAQKALTQFREISFHEEFNFGPIQFEFFLAGHILSAASIRVQVTDGPSLLFSGDLGRSNDWITPKPENPPTADYVIMESTYGDRMHEPGDPLEHLLEVLRETVEKKSVLLIPAFALGRAQTLLFGFYQLFKQFPKLKVPLYLDSPMATDITKLYYAHRHLHSLSEENLKNMCLATRFVQSPQESKDLNEKKGPMIIVASSGMLTGGRILHHLKYHGQNPNNQILLVGYQSPGTRGAVLASGGKQIKIHGQVVDIQARVSKLDAFSAHGDQTDLLTWASKISPHPKKVFLVHGENQARQALNDHLLKRQMKVHLPNQGEKVNL